jgi:hypothetical protein
MAQGGLLGTIGKYANYCFILVCDAVLSWTFSLYHQDLRVVGTGIVVNIYHLCTIISQETVRTPNPEMGNTHVIKVEIKQNRSLMVAVQGPDCVPLVIHTKSKYLNGSNNSEDSDNKPYSPTGNNFSKTLASCCFRNSSVHKVKRLVSIYKTLYRNMPEHYNLNIWCLKSQLWILGNRRIILK